MATPIDREEVLYQLERLALEAQLTDECEEEAIRRCIKVIEQLVPTLTPPNEPLTCKGCVYHEYDIGLCTDCARMQHGVDYYWPKEGKGKA